MHSEDYKRGEVPDGVRILSGPITRRMPRYKKEKPKHPVLGAEYVPLLYATISIVGRPGSGKTELIFNLLDACCGPETVVIIFCSTIHSDKSWGDILEFLTQNDIAYVVKTSIKETDPKTGEIHNFIDEFMEGRVAQGKIDEAKRNGEGKMLFSNRFEPLGGNFGLGLEKKEKEHLPTIDPSRRLVRHMNMRRIS